MRVVIAPGQLAGALSAGEAARAMAQGWRLQWPGDQLALVPMADGGEGTIEVVSARMPGARRRQIEVADARGRAVHAGWLSLPDGRALVEAAQACGLARLAPGERDPLLATSYGVGQLIAAAAEGHREIVVGVAGTATMDGGGGMATALGHGLRRADGNSLKVGGRFLLDLERIEAAPRVPATVVVCTDATLPLLGPSGAVAATALAKGASDQDLALLEAALTRLAGIAERDLRGGPWRDIPGAGAAGGLGFGLAAFCHARIEPGAATIADLVGLDQALEGTTVVLTGEDALGAFVSSRARERGALVLAVPAPPGDPRDAASLVAARTADLARTIDR